ncbi:MAG: PspC domain-containing protein [SAR202 cluster bacterium]|nr:PspC domain-containing protein [SAR202 cluster bacterium]
MAAPRRLHKSSTQKMLFGVLGGLAEYLGSDPTLVRVIFVLVMILTGFMPAVLVYLLAAILVPQD